MIQEISKVKNIKGELTLPGDKSVSHRSIIFSSLAGGNSKISNLLESDDVFSTISCFKKLGCEIDKVDDSYIVKGKGFINFVQPISKLNAGNSGTTARLISGILSAQNFESKLVGDESLSKRPMERVSKPLSLMGAKISLSENRTLPAIFSPSQNLHRIDYELEVASAQVKSALLLLGIHLEEESKIIERYVTRDHTERMLGCKIESTENKNIIHVSKKNYPQPNDYVVPSDISTAAFFIVLTLLTENSELLLKNISLNPTRTGVINILQNMGGNIAIENRKTIAGEDLGDLVIKSSSLKNVEIEENLIPNIIDEIPILSVAGLLAEGNFVIKNASELRVKESDRIEALVENYKLLGLKVNEFEDGFELSGEIRNKDVQFESFGDHRIAMTFAVLSSLLFEKGSINNFNCVKISNPNFLHQLTTITS